MNCVSYTYIYQSALNANLDHLHATLYFLFVFTQSCKNPAQINW